MNCFVRGIPDCSMGATVCSAPVKVRVLIWVCKYRFRCLIAGIHAFKSKHQRLSTYITLWHLEYHSFQFLVCLAFTIGCKALELYCRLRKRDFLNSSPVYIHNITVLFPGVTYYLVQNFLTIPTVHLKGDISLEATMQSYCYHYTLI